MSLTGSSLLKFMHQISKQPDSKNLGTNLCIALGSALTCLKFMAYEGVNIYFVRSVELYLIRSEPYTHQPLGSCT